MKKVITPRWVCNKNIAYYTICTDNSGTFKDDDVCVISAVFAEKGEERRAFRPVIVARGDTGFYGTFHFKEVIARRPGRHGRAIERLIEEYFDTGWKDSNLKIDVIIRRHLKYQRERYEATNNSGIEVPSHIIEHNYWTKSCVTGGATYFCNKNHLDYIVADVYTDQRVETLDFEYNGKIYKFEDYMKRDNSERYTRCRIRNVTPFCAGDRDILDPVGGFHALCDVFSGTIRQAFTNSPSKDSLKRKLASLVLYRMYEKRDDSDFKEHVSFSLFPNEDGRFEDLLNTSEERFLNFLSRLYREKLVRSLPKKITVK